MTTEDSAMVDILAVGAHPDDIEIGAGGALAELIRRGKSVALLDLTNGEPTPHGSPEIRKRETEKANSILGVKQRIMLDFKNRELMDGISARKKVAEVYRKLRPKTLLLLHWVDAHPDHVQASSMAQSARFVAKYTKTEMAGEPYYPPKLFYYYCLHLKKNIQPTFIFDISETLEVKIEALSAYQSQFFAGDKKRGEAIIEKTRTRAAFFGERIGVKYGEPFFSVEEIGVNSFDSLLP